MGSKSKGAWVLRQHHHILDMYHNGRVHALGAGAWMGDCEAWEIMLEPMEEEGERQVESLAAEEVELGLEVEAGAEEKEPCMCEWR